MADFYYMYQIDNILEDINEIKEGQEKELFACMEDLKSSINLINAKKEQLWHILKRFNEYLPKFGNFSEIKYEDFQPEIYVGCDRDITAKDIKDSLEKLKESMYSTKKQYDNLPILGFNVFKKRDIDADNCAQIRLYKYIEGYWNNYKKNLELEIPYYKELKAIVDIYRNTLNKLFDVVEDRIIPEFETIELFLKAFEIKDLIKKKKDIQNMSYKDIKINISISDLKETKYNQYYTFIVNALLLCRYIREDFEKISLGKYLYPEKIMQNNSIYFDRSNHTEWLSYNGVIEIDMTDEFRHYSINDYEKIPSYTIESNNEEKNTLELNKEEFVKITENLEKSESIINNL